VTFVKNERWSAGYFEVHSGMEHLHQGENSNLSNQLFFEGNTLSRVFIICYRLNHLV